MNVLALLITQRQRLESKIRGLVQVFENCITYEDNERIEGNYNVDLVAKFMTSSNCQFRLHFRMSIKNFEKILNMLALLLRKNKKKILCLRIKLMATLWLFATQESFQAVAVRFKLSQGSLHYAFVRIVNAIQMQASKFIKWPQNRYEMNSSFIKRDGLNDVKGVIDCSYIQIRKPNIRGDDYVCRKKYAAITLQAVCNSKMEFLNCYAGWPSSVHDALILKNSDFYCKVQRNISEYFSDEEYILGDEAYPLLKWLMIPYENDRIFDDYQVNFNEKHSTARSVIEKTFALLKGRFRRLKYLDMSIKYIPASILACCVLHNICLNEGDFDQFINEGEVCSFQSNFKFFFQLHFGFFYAINIFCHRMIIIISYY